MGGLDSGRWDLALASERRSWLFSVVPSRAFERTEASIDNSRRMERKVRVSFSS